MRNSVRIQNIMLWLALILSLGISDIEAQDINFQVEPGRCISLHRGQLCYQRLNMTWNTVPGLEYCLGELQSAATFDSLVCWTGNELLMQEVEFQSNSDVTYQIRLRDEQTVLAELLVEVAWVYKTGRTTFSRWRLF